MTAETVASGGWQVAAGFASTQMPDYSGHFYALYPGEAFNHPERGIIAALARAHPQAPGHLKAAADSAQLAGHALAEGYFGAQRTLSSRRAASLAVTAINRWLYSQINTDVARHLVPVSLTALMFFGAKIGIAQIGACQLYRARAATLAPLMREQLRGLPDAARMPTRAIGLDLAISIDYAEEDAQAGDRYILLAGLEARPPDTLYHSIAERLPAGLGAGDFAQALLAALGHADAAQKSVMVLDVVAVPREDQAGHGGTLGDLPLRPAPRQGDTWDGFVIGKTLYRGRYTMLKAAYDSIEKRDVALKIPLPSMLQDEIFAAGFMREAWIGTTVRGAAIARYIELPPDRRSSLYLVMPLYRGETLEARLNHPPLVNLPEGIGIALKLCEAVQDLAAIQIIHRDIKPDNVMLLEEKNEIRLLDLGLAYLPGIDVADAVKPGGTIRYMAPELLQGVAANARSEVFALGITIYRMFSGGAFPFGQREAVPLARLRPDLPHWLGACLARAMAPKPAERYADAGAFAQALQIGLVNAQETLADTRPRLPLTRLQIWQALTFVFAGALAFLLLRGVK